MLIVLGVIEVIHRLMYLLESYEGTEKIMGVILSAAYIVAKGSDILQRVKFLKRSFIKFLQKTVRQF